MTRARDTLVPGDVVMMNLDCGNAVASNYRNRIVLIVANFDTFRRYKVIGQLDGKLHEHQLHNDWQKIGHIDQWAEMVKP